MSHSVMNMAENRIFFGHFPSMVSIIFECVSGMNLMTAGEIATVAEIAICTLLLKLGDVQPNMASVF